MLLDALCLMTAVFLGVLVPMYRAVYETVETHDSMVGWCKLNPG